MLPRPNRLSDSRDIARVYRKGRSAKSGLFRVSWLPNRSRAVRAVVITSRKLSTRAAQRNLLKRQVRYILHEALSGLEPVDLIVQLLPSVIRSARAKDRESARKQVLHTLEYAVLKADLLDLLGRQRLLSTSNKESGMKN